MTANDFTSVHQARSVAISLGQCSLRGRAIALLLAVIRRLDLGTTPSQLLRLNDHLLRDIGRSRADLEVQAMDWPFRATRSNHPD